MSNILWGDKDEVAAAECYPASIPGGDMARSERMTVEDVYLLLSHILKEIQKMATGLAALQTVDTALASAITENTTATQAIVADLQTITAELSNIPAGDPDNQVAAVAQDLQNKLAALEANTKALQDAVTPPAAPVTTPNPSSPAPTA